MVVRALVGTRMSRLRAGSGGGGAVVPSGGLMSLFVNDATSLDPMPATTGSPNVGTNVGINGSGWVATVVLKGITSLIGTCDPTKLTLYVSDPGYDTSGNPTTVLRTLTGVAQVRRQQPNGNTMQMSTDGANLTVLVSLSDWVYAGTTIVSATLASGFYTGSVAGNAGAAIQNKSVTPYTQPIVGWINAQEMSCGSTYPVEFLAFHRHAMAGQQVACVKFSSSDGTNTTPVVTASTPALSNLVNKGNIPETWQATLNMANQTQGAMCNVNAIVYPWLGDSTAVLNLATAGLAWPTSLGQTLLRVLCDGTGAYGGAYAYVKVGALGGAVSATPATAAAAPFPTINAALQAAQSWNNTNRGHNDVGGATVRLMDASGSRATHMQSGNPSINAGLTYCTVEADPAATGTVAIAWDARTQYPDMMRWHGNILVQVTPGQTFTAAPSAGATSGTLTTAWSGNTSSRIISFVETSSFAVEDRLATFTTGSTAVTWTPALSANCNATTTWQNYPWIGPATDRSKWVVDGVSLDLDGGATSLMSQVSMKYLYNLTHIAGAPVQWQQFSPTTDNIAIMAGCVATTTAYSIPAVKTHVGCINPIYVKLPDALSQTDGDDGGIFYNNRVQCAQFNTGGTYVRGYAVVQNQFENNLQVTAASSSWFADNDLTTITNFIEMNSTAVGQRASHLYNSQGNTQIAPYGLTKQGVLKYNIWDNFNYIDDRFNNHGVGYGSVGAWSSGGYQVGNAGNVSLFGEVTRSSTMLPSNNNSGTPLGDAWLPSSEPNLGRVAYGLSQAQIMSMFVNYLTAPGTVSTSGGDYRPLSTSSYLKGRVPAGQSILKYDLNGTLRRTDGTGAAGAYESL